MASNEFMQPTENSTIVQREEVYANFAHGMVNYQYAYCPPQQNAYYSNGYNEFYRDDSYRGNAEYDRRQRSDENYHGGPLEASAGEKLAGGNGKHWQTWQQESEFSSYPRSERNGDERRSARGKSYKNGQGNYDETKSKNVKAKTNFVNSGETAPISGLGENLVRSDNSHLDGSSTSNPSEGAVCSKIVNRSSDVENGKNESSF